MKDILIRLSVLCITKGDIPNAKIGNTYSLCNCRYFFSIRSRVFEPRKKYNTQIAEIACDIIVANAAPETPICNPKINIGSKIILAAAPIKIVPIPVKENPCAVIKLFKPREIMTKILPHT